MLVSILGKRESNLCELMTAFYKCQLCPPGYASVLHPVTIKVTEHDALTKKEVHFITFHSAELLGRVASRPLPSRKN